MQNSWLQCDFCESRYAIGPLLFGCPSCAKQGLRRPLEVKYGETQLTPEPSAGVWRWAGLLPWVAPAHRVTLHEGATPLVPLSLPGIATEVYLKNESVNPTWSWKDRPNVVSVSVAKQMGFECITAKSTGNHGNAAAAYASAAGLSATILCNPETPELQLALMEGYGARVILGGDQDRIIHDLIATKKHFPCTILCPQAGYSNPYGVEGFKTIAFEIVEALGGSAPDRVFVATGSGDGIYGIWKGFRELAERNQIERAPRMMACQPHGANSAWRAWHVGRHHVEPLAHVSTRALSVAEAATGDHALRAVYESRGEMRECSECEIEEAARVLRRKGFALELASSLPYACLRGMPHDGPSRDVLVGSGAAVKWPETILKGFQKPEELARDVTHTG